MGDVFQIIGSVLLIVVGVAVITYVLFRKSPVKSEEPEDEAQDGSAEEGDEVAGDEPADDVPEGEAPVEIGPEKK